MIDFLVTRRKEHFIFHRWSSNIYFFDFESCWAFVFGLHTRVDVFIVGERQRAKRLP